MTNEELQKLKDLLLPELKTALLAEAQGVGDNDVRPVSSLKDIKSLLAYLKVGLDVEIVEAPLSLLQVEIQTTEANVQWRLGEGDWENIIAISDLQKPATDAAKRADEKMVQISKEVNLIIADTNKVKETALDVANHPTRIDKDCTVEIYNPTTKQYQKTDINVKGSKGDTGVTGATGTTGATGPTGPKGDTGVQGVKGDKGDQGIQGLLGMKGDKGDIGPAGPVGPVGAKGATGDDFTIKGYFPTESELRRTITSPRPGDTYSVGSSEPYYIYIYDGLRGDWVNNGTLKGEKGDKGDSGIVANLSPGLFGLRIENGHLILTHNTNDPVPPMRIDENGHLVYIIS